MTEFATDAATAERRTTESTAQAAQTKEVWENFVESNENAGKLESLMTRLIDPEQGGNPGLLVLDKGTRAFRSSLEQLLDLAENKVRKAAASRRTKRSGSLDNSRGRRTQRQSGHRDNVNPHAARAFQTDTDRDWSKVVEGLLERD